MLGKIFKTQLLTRKPISSGYIKLKSGAECDSSDESLGDFSSVQECANACAAKPQCKFFVYDTGSTYCYWEKTTSADCSEGWDSDSYDFYGLTNDTGIYSLVITVHTKNQLSIMRIS